MTIHIREVRGITVLDIDGYLLYGESSRQLRGSIIKLLAQDKKLIALNGEKVSYADSSGIGEMFYAHQYIQKLGGKLALFAFNKRIIEVLKLYKADTILHIYETEAEALATSPITRGVL